MAATSSNDNKNGITENGAKCIRILTHRQQEIKSETGNTKIPRSNEILGNIESIGINIV